MAREKRVLIFGNAAYKNLPVLDDCTRDAELMAKVFRQLGFSVHGDAPVLNASRAAMRKALAEFRKTLNPDTEAVVYFSGHGIQLRGENFLVPVDFAASFQYEAEDQAITLDSILKMLDDAGVPLKLVVLDSCRDPGNLLPGEPAAKNIPKGLADPNISGVDTLVCFATKHGTPAFATGDESPNSIYTGILAEEIVKPVKLEDALKKTAIRVFDKTGKKQLPFTYGSLLSEVFMAGKSSVPPPPPLQPKTIAERIAAATKDAPFENDLGMQFVPVPETSVLMCRTETRLREWEEFMEANPKHDMSGGMYVLKVKKDDKGAYTIAWELDKNASWKSPGFSQTAEHPVVGVSWEDAKAFAAWLSKRDGVTYRLPTDREWSAAVGSSKYPWGDAAKPPAKAGNYGDSRYLDSLSELSGGAAWSGDLSTFTDGYERTAPAGSFAANRLGIYDLGGNVWEWCEDKYRASMNDSEALEKYSVMKDEKASDGTPFRVLRGASWFSYDSVYLRSASRSCVHPACRNGNYGFRLVVSVR